MKYIGRAILVTLFGVTLFSCAKGPEFTYIPPDGWEMISSPRLKYKVAYGKPVNGFAPNINVVDDDFNGTLEDYFGRNLKLVESYFQGYQFIDKGEFITNKGDKGFKLVYEADQQEMRLQLMQYFLGQGKKMFVITYTRPSGAGTELDTLCEGSIRTFQFK